MSTFRLGSLRIACWLALLLLITSAAAEPRMTAPSELQVESQSSVFRGRWKAVPGASHYEVWINQYGAWRFDSKNPDCAPFTSSFEMRGLDERTWFRVRAVSSTGQPGEFSEEVQARVIAEAPGATGTSREGLRGGSSSDAFDPEAPAPEPPSGMFAVWTDTREIRLVWQASPNAARYTVEEFVEGRWTSLTKIDFPKPTSAIIKDKPQPGPYQFRIRAIGRNGRASEPSRPTTAKMSR